MHFKISDNEASEFSALHLSWQASSISHPTGTGKPVMARGDNEPRSLECVSPQITCEVPLRCGARGPSCCPALLRRELPLHRPVQLSQRGRQIELGGGRTKVHSAICTLHVILSWTIEARAVARIFNYVEYTETKHGVFPSIAVSRSRF